MKVLRAGGALQNASRSSTISHYGFTFARRAHGVRENIGQRLSWRCVLRIHEYVSYGASPITITGMGWPGFDVDQARRGAVRHAVRRREGRRRLLPAPWPRSCGAPPAAPSVASQCRAVGPARRASACARVVSPTPRAVVVRRAACLVGYRVSHIASLFLKLYSSRTKKRAFNDPHQTTVAAASAHVSSDARHATAAVETTSSVRKCNRRTCSIYGAAFFSRGAARLALQLVAVGSIGHPSHLQTHFEEDEGQLRFTTWSSNLGTASAFTSHHLISTIESARSSCENTSSG